MWKIESQKFDHIGVFTFSPEEESTAAKLPNQVDKNIAEARKDQIMAIQQPIAEKLNKCWVGKTVDVLINGAGINAPTSFLDIKGGYSVLSKLLKQIMNKIIMGKIF